MIDKIKELINYANSLCNDTDFSVRFTIKKLFGNSNIYGYVTTGYDSPKREMVISLHNIINHFGSDISFVETLIAIHHEFKHIEQFNEIMKGQADDVTLINYLLREQNDELYYDNYTILPFPYEIEAESEGVLNTYEYLNEFHSKDIDAWKCIKQIIDKKVHSVAPDTRYNNDKIINHKSIQSVEEGFYELYRDSIVNAINVKNIITDFKNNNYKHKIENNCIYTLIQEIGLKGFNDIMEYVPYKQSYGEQENNREKGKWQSRFLASYILKIKPNLRDKIDLSIIEPIDFYAYKYAVFKIQHDPLFNNPLISGSYKEKTAKVENWINEYNSNSSIREKFLKNIHIKINDRER